MNFSEELTIVLHSFNFFGVLCAWVGRRTFQDMLEKAITEYEVVKVSADTMVKQVEDLSFDKMVESVTVRC